MDGCKKSALGNSCGQGDESLLRIWKVTCRACIMGDWKLLVSKEARRLLADASTSGLLIGCVDAQEKEIIVLGACPAGNGSTADVARLQEMLPYGMSILGAYAVNSASERAALPACVHGLSQEPQVLAAVKSPEVHYTVAGQAVEPCQAAVAAPGDLPVPRGWVALRCQLMCELPVMQPASDESQDGAAHTRALAAGFQELERTLQGGGEDLALLVEAREGATQALFTDAPGSLVDALGGEATCISTQFMTCSKSSGWQQPTAPAYEYVPTAQGPGPAAQQLVRVPLHLDVVCLMPARSDAAAAPTSVCRALLSQLHVIKHSLGVLSAPTPAAAYHFSPRGLGFLVTLVYPQLAEDSEESITALLPLRRQAHELLGLPMDIPMLRPANALSIVRGDAAASTTLVTNKAGRLANVHATLQQPNVNGPVELVQGSYLYYHYQQDKLNDSGWGCAYRSLQTIVSWFQEQGYTSKPVPTHREIQATLVKLGDKDPSFIGSSQWIGAIELGYILDEYLGISYKVITVPRGDEIPSYARQLAAHFANQGTPVMIGGGVLAYTLLGVAFDEATGDASFLILDPHYTGGEELKKMHSGGWVAWKKLGDNAAAGGPLFVPGAFYNFLCPQRPRSC